MIDDLCRTVLKLLNFKHFQLNIGKLFDYESILWKPYRYIYYNICNIIYKFVWNILTINIFAIKYWKLINGVLSFPEKCKNNFVNLLIHDQNTIPLANMLKHIYIFHWT